MSACPQKSRVSPPARWSKRRRGGGQATFAQPLSRRRFRALGWRRDKPTTCPVAHHPQPRTRGSSPSTWRYWVEGGDRRSRRTHADRARPHTDARACNAAGRAAGISPSSYGALDVDASVIGVSVGFPGVVRHGQVLTAANLGTGWTRFDLAKALTKLWKKPVRVVNDADMQGLGAAGGSGSRSAS